MQPAQDQHQVSVMPVALIPIGAMPQAVRSGVHVGVLPLAHAVDSPCNKQQAMLGRALVVPGLLPFQAAAGAPQESQQLQAQTEWANLMGMQQQPPPPSPLSPAYNNGIRNRSAPPTNNELLEDAVRQMEAECLKAAMPEVYED